MSARFGSIMIALLMMATACKQTDPERACIAFCNFVIVRVDQSSPLAKAVPKARGAPYD